MCSELPRKFREQLHHRLVTINSSIFLYHLKSLKYNSDGSRSNSVETIAKENRMNLDDTNLNDKETHANS